METAHKAFQLFFSSFLKYLFFHQNTIDTSLETYLLRGGGAVSELTFLILMLEKNNVIFGINAVQNLRKDSLIFKIANFDKKLAKFGILTPKMTKH